MGASCDTDKKKKGPKSNDEPGEEGNGDVKMGSGQNEEIKVLILGDAAVGKTALLLRITDKKYSTSIPINLDCRSTDIIPRGSSNPRKVTIWDTAGQERFRTITSSFYRDANGVLLAFDMCSRASFESVRQWSKEIDTYGHDLMIKILVGTKCDCAATRTVQKKEAMALANELMMDYIETSAKDDINVTECIQRLVEEVISLHAKR